MTTVPKHAQRRIYLHNQIDQKTGQYTDKLVMSGDDFVATGVILVGYCPDTLDYFRALYRHAKEAFPLLEECEVTCGKVKKSDSIDGYTVLVFGLTNHLSGWRPMEDERNSVKHGNHRYIQYLPYKTGEIEIPVFVNIDFGY